MKNTVSANIGGKTITIETGRLAKQADGSVLITCGRLIWALIKLSIDPSKTHLIFDVADRLRTLGGFKEANARIEADPRNRLLFERKLLQQPVDLHGLAKLPEGTLGRTYAEHMISRNLDQEFYRPLDIKDETSFYIMRIRQTHDLWHVVTGFGTDVVSEIGLQAVMLAYLALPMAAILTGGGLIRASIREPSQLGPMVEAVIKGFAMGRKANGLFAFDWSANWARPLADVRKELNLA